MPSCTAALELAALLLDLEAGDEVIVPDFTFVSSANAFVLRGAIPVLVDVDPRTLCVDPVAVERALTPKTRAICVVHYAGASADMEAIHRIAKSHNIFVIEDAAQGISARTKGGKALGTVGVFGALSFHHTKNVGCGEGGAILINEERYFERAEIIREKGTNRKHFFRGMIDKYTWVDIGSSYILSELQAAFLLAQLETAQATNEKRRSLWQTYLAAFDASGLREERLDWPESPLHGKHNAHAWWIVMSDAQLRSELMAYLKHSGVETAFHYQSLAKSPGGQKFCRVSGELTVSQRASDGLLRLPIHCGMTEDDVTYVVEKVQQFFKGRP
jgi:dTDP-4-amino-4,6-dideoxygalactose transaminase